MDAFLTEVRHMPGFIAASAIDPKWSEHLDAIERGLTAIYNSAAAEMIEAFDKIQAVIDRADLSIKEQLVEIGKLLTEARAAGRSVH